MKKLKQRLPFTNTPEQKEITIPMKEHNLVQVARRQDLKDNGNLSRLDVHIRRDQKCHSSNT
jgi:hypothetical protein